MLTIDNTPRTETEFIVLQADTGKVRHLTAEEWEDLPSVLYSKFAGKSGRRWPGFGRRSWSRQKVWGLRW